MITRLRKRSSRLGRIVPVLAAAGLLAACSGGSVSSSKPKMTPAQASTRAEQILRDTAAALNPKPQLEPDPTMTFTDQCLGNQAHADQMVQYTLTYWLRGITESQNTTIGAQIKTYWEKQRYDITDAKGLAKGQPTINGFTRDDFSISLGWSVGGALSIGTTSPCFYPHGTP
jgi:hypothetical protein